MSRFGYEYIEVATILGNIDTRNQVKILCYQLSRIRENFYVKRKQTKERIRGIVLENSGKSRFLIIKFEFLSFFFRLESLLSLYVKNFDKLSTFYLKDRLQKARKRYENGLYVFL